MPNRRKSATLLLRDKSRVWSFFVSTVREGMVWLETCPDIDAVQILMFRRKKIRFSFFSNERF
ncbi:MAG: hypothetical protein J7K00_02665 [Candidatus Diapherotrites archaeon]|nr:hypothetical protein [Candidatus Diapherotrites archaeon]